jgi:prepilin-type N-terminal cleavage/methylation domain-containing protein
MRKKLKGFSLLELVIAMALGAIFLLLSSSALIQSAKTNRIAQEHSYLQEGAFFAKEFLEQDLRRAGYYAGLKSAQEITGSSKIVPFDKTCAKASDQFVRQVFPKIFGLNNFAKDFLCVEKHYLNSDILSMHYLRPTEAVNSAANKNDMFYMRVSTTQGKFFKARDQANSGNQIIDEHNELYELVALIYYVRDTGRRCDSAVIPGLYREYNNASGFMEAEEIVSGVEQLQIQYSINGMLFNADEITGEQQWQSVDAVSIWLLMRSDCFEFSDPQDRQFQMGDIYFDERFNNKNYLRQLYKFDISLRN